MAGFTFKQLLNGDIFRAEPVQKQYPLLWLIGALVIIYIMAGYQAIDQQNEIYSLRQELKTAQFQYLSIYAEYANMTRQSTVTDWLETKQSTLETNLRPLRKIE